MEGKIIIYVIVAFINVFLHILRSIMVIKSTRFTASLANCICYTFSAVVIKFIAEVDMYTAIIVQSTTNFFGCWVAMWFADKVIKIDKKKTNDGQAQGEIGEPAEI